MSGYYNHYFGNYNTYSFSPFSYKNDLNKDTAKEENNTEENNSCIFFLICEVRKIIIFSLYFCFSTGCLIYIMITC